MSETVVKPNDVWNNFAARSEGAMAAVKAEGPAKPEGQEQIGCVVGIQVAPVEVAGGQIFCIMGLSGSGKSTQG